MLSRGKGWEIARPLYLYRLHPNSLLHTQIQPSNQSYQVLAKYAPDQLYLYPEESMQRSKTGARYSQKLWLRIAEMELLTGDRKAVLQTTEFLEQGGVFEKKAKLIRWFTYLGRAGSFYYRWRKRSQYRYRPDWETLFTTLVGPLTLD